MSAPRRIFIGDVQGCRDALERLLEALHLDPLNDRLFFTGDLVNRGPDSLGTLRLCRTLQAESVLGNHDVFLLELAAGRASPGSTGRGHTLDPVLAAPDRDELLDWLRARPLLVHLGDIVVVHAAIRPTWTDLKATAVELTRRFGEYLARGVSPFEHDDLRFALSARYCDAQGRQARPDHPPPGPPFRNWIEFYRGSETVVFGHFARQGLLMRPRLRGLDTGCVWGGKLTAWIAEEDRIVSVAAT